MPFYGLSLILLSSSDGEEAQLPPHEPHRVPQLGRRRVEGLVRLLRPPGIHFTSLHFGRKIFGQIFVQSVIK
jgi:hypothetical protein